MIHLDLLDKDEDLDSDNPFHSDYDNQTTLDKLQMDKDQTTSEWVEKTNPSMHFSDISLEYVKTFL